MIFEGIPFFDLDGAEFLTTEQLLLLGGASGGKTVEDTATGNPVTFLTDLAKPLKSLVANFLPIQATGTPSPDNILPITGWSGLSVWNISGDLVRCTRTTSQETNGLKYTPIVGSDMKPIGFNVNGARTGSNSFYNLFGNQADTIPVGMYKVSGYTANVAIRVYATIEGNESKLFDSANGDTTFTVTQEMTRAWARLQILSPLNESINETVYPIIMSADSSVTVYPVTFLFGIAGGYIDLISGELYATWAGIKKKWSEGDSATDMGSGITRKAFLMVDNLTTGSANNKCNIAPYSANENAEAHFYYSGSGATNRKARVFLPSETDGDTQIEIITKLSAPALITTLTPQQITALVGNNTIWSDADGSMTAVYLKKG